jgi:hypothetical protein
LESDIVYCPVCKTVGKIYYEPTADQLIALGIPAKEPQRKKRLPPVCMIPGCGCSGEAHA